MHDADRVATRAVALCLISLLVLATTTMLVARGGSLPAVDEALNTALEPLRQPAILVATQVLSLVGGPVGAIIIVIAASALFWVQRRRVAAYALWGIAVAVPVSMEALKSVIARPRPEPLAGIVETGWSFPSGTATFAAALFGYLACVLVRDMRPPARRQALLFAVAALVALVGFSRMVLSVHYLSDVIAGMALGAFWASAGVAVLARIAWDEPAGA